METQIKSLFRRVLSLALSLVMLITLGFSALPVSAAKSDPQQNLDKTYGAVTNIAIQGVCDYKAAYQVLNIVNAERKKVGKKALAMDKTLMESAMQRAAECSIFYSHTRPNGEHCLSILSQKYSRGENIAAGYTTAAATMEGWMASELHRFNILDQNNLQFQSIGIGVFVVDGIYYWCQLFSGQKKTANPTQKKAVTKVMTVEARKKTLALSINSKKVTLEANHTYTLEVKNMNSGIVNAPPEFQYTIDPHGLKFVSDEPSVATVSDKGVITPVGDGKTTIKVNSANGVNLFSVSVTAKNETVRATITHSSNGKPTISWNKVTGATSYKVYKSEYKSGKWSSAKLFKTTKTLSCVDNAITSGAKVKYTVYAYKGSKKFSSHDTVTTTYLAQPTVKVATTATGVKVSWGKVTGATSYKVYKSEYKSGKWTAYTAIKATSSLSHTDTKVKSGQKVRYTVYAVKGSIKSAEKTGVAITYLAQPKAKVAKATKGVKLSWGKVTGATSYKVYKSEYKNGKWTAYKAVKSTTASSYTDTKVKSKQKVRYTVYAVNGSNKSAEKAGVSITR